MKTCKRILLGLVVLLVLSSLGIYFFMRTSLAPLDGTVKIQNLSHPVKVTRDTYGIPHIYAANKLDALRALGFVIASERLFQLEVSRRLTQGELSEVLGDVTLKLDTLYRSLMLKRSVERMIAWEKSHGTFDEKIWAEMEAYCDGINQYVATRPLPYEMKLLGITPRPFTPLDAYIMTGHMAYGFSIALKAESVMSQLATKLPEAQFQNLRNDVLKAPFKVSENSNVKMFADLAKQNYFPAFEGSNAWLVSPRRSQSGKSIFSNDPHIGFSSPAVWFEAHLETPEFEIYGHFLPLVPFPVLGHNHHHAWGFTMALNDDMDLYRETLDREKKTVLYKNKPVPYEEWKEVIKVKNQPDVVLNFIETPHGPLMDETLSEKSLALKWAFHRPENDTMKALYSMSEAKDIKSFEAGLQYATAPGLNVMYADAENIAWWMFGDIVVKKNPNSDMLLDGSRGNDEYERILSWNEKPHSVNPPEGVIVSANSRPPGLTETIRGDWQSDDRFQTITRALGEKDLWNAEDFKALQTENFNYQTKNILEKLFENLQLTPEETQKYAKQLAALKTWNFRSEINSTEAALYHQWNNENILLMLGGLDEDLRAGYLGTPYAWVFYERVILNPQAAWWSDKKYSEIVTQGFKNTLAKISEDTTWGQIHTIEYIHPLGRTSPLNKIFNLGPYPIPGAYNDINNNRMRDLGKDFKVTSGPSTRRIVDFAHPQKSWGINPIGISGHKLSPYYKDQVQMFIEGKYRAQLMDEKDIQEAKAHELILE